MPDAKLRLAVGLTCLAAFLDAIDGPIARYTHTSGPFGCNLDSLADVVSFGVTPAVVLYLAQLHRVPVAGVVASVAFCTCGALRLARSRCARVARRSSAARSRSLRFLPPCSQPSRQARSRRS